MNARRIAAALRELADALEEAGPAPKAEPAPKAPKLEVDEVAKARARRSLRRFGLSLEDE